MARSVWKGPFVEDSLMKKVDKYKQDSKKYQLKLGLENQQLYQIS
jgi:small subunit ribosomal protein S19